MHINRETSPFGGYTIEDKEEVKLDNVVDFTKVKADGIIPTDGDWLAALEVGTVFLARDKKNLSNYNLGKFWLLEKSEKSVMLRTPAAPHDLHMISAGFCRDYSLHEIKGVLSMQQEQEPVENADERNRNEGESGSAV